MKNKPIYGPDYHIVLFIYMGFKLRKNFKINRDRPSNLLIQRFIDKYSNKGSRNLQEDLIAIRDIQKMIEDEMSRLISKKGIYYWFHLYRRIAPKATFGENPQTLILYRNILECAFLKYGSNNCGSEIILSKDSNLVSTSEIASGHFKNALLHFGASEEILKVKNDGIFLGKFEYTDAIEIYQLERLAFEFWHSTVCYRRVNKGGKLIIDSSRYYVKNDPITEILINIYDKRVNEFDEFSSSSGVILNNQGLDKKKGVTLVPQYNAKEIKNSEYPQDILFLSKFLQKGNLDIVYNFIWAPLDFNYYYIVNEFYSNEFLKYYGYKLEAFVQTLYLILKSEIFFCAIDDQPIGLELLKRAYRRFSSIEKLAENLVSISSSIKLPSLVDYILSLNDALCVLKGLCFSTEYRKCISLSTLGPRCLIFPSVDGGINVDYASIPFILRTMMHKLTPIDDKKGHLFENVVINRLEMAKVNIWLSTKTLKGRDNTSREIDVSFIIGNTLFIAELKSNIQAITYIEGNKATLEHRKKKNLEGIIQADDVVDWLLAHTEGRNFKIPKGVEYIASIMVSPFIEYIWTDDEYLWIDSNTPRICSVSECCNLEKIINFDEFIKRKYVKKII